MALSCIVLSWEVGCLKYSCLLPALDNLASFARPLCFQWIVEKIELEVESMPRTYPPHQSW